MNTTKTWFLSAWMAAAVAMPLAAQADQPAMEAALRHLEQARGSLQNATVDKGGHRRKALKAVDAAIAEVKAGMAFDARHSGPNEGKRKP